MKTKLIILLLSLFCLNSMAQINDYHYKGKKTEKKKKTSSGAASSTEEYINIDGIYYDLDFSKKKATVTYLDSNSGSNKDAYSGNVVIPKTVSYKNKVFSVTSIGEYAFSSCSDLTSVTIPNSVTSIGGDAFIDCKGLTSIEIPNSVTSIGSQAFEFCEGLTAITIPNSVRSIGSGAFCGCEGLTSIIVDDGNKVYDSRDNCNAIIKTANNTLISGCNNTVIPVSVTSIGKEAFEFCNGLKSITIPNSVKSIGRSAFYGCDSLTSVVIPNSVTSIGDGAFLSCSGLTSVTIPNSVTSIEGGAFQGCSKLKEVTCRATNVPTTEITAFGSIWRATLYVPASSLNAYKSKEPWKDFGTIKAIGQ